MRTGNPKAVAVLTVIAVAAIAFLVYRLMPPARVATSAGGKSSQEGARASYGANLTATVIGDPFWHPKLAHVESGVVVHPPAAPRDAGRRERPVESDARQRPDRT